MAATRAAYLRFLDRRLERGLGARGDDLIAELNAEAGSFCGVGARAAHNDEKSTVSQSEATLNARCSLFHGLERHGISDILPFQALKLRFERR